jgi:hypothetical protein
VPIFRRFLGGPTGRFLRAEEGRHAGQASRYGSCLGLRKFLKGGIVWRLFAHRLGLLQKGTTNRSERHQQKHVTVKPVLLGLINRKTGIILRFWCFLVPFWCFYFAR